MPMQQRDSVEGFEPSAEVQAVLDLDGQLDVALDRRDTKVVERLYADEFALNSPTNRVQSRSETIHLVASTAARQHDVERTIEGAYMSGDVVVIMGRESLRWEGTGTALDGRRTDRRFTNVWRRIDGQWLRIARQATNIRRV